MRTSRYGESLRDRHGPLAVELIVERTVEDAPREEDGRVKHASQLVSVIVPVYNVDRHVKQCVESLSEQTHSRIEIILVDDGSTDRSGNLCDDFSANDSRVRVIHQENAGLSAARNAGISIARGDWLFFVDSDDWVSRDAIDDLLAVANRVTADIVVGGFLRVGDNVPRGHSAPPGVVEELLLTGDEILTALLGPMHTLLTVAWGKLFRKDLFSKLMFPVGRVHEDEFVSHRLLHAARRVVVLPKPSYFYRQHSGSIMGKGFNPKKAMDAIDAYTDRLNFLREVGRTDLLPLARAQLFRKYMAFYRGTSLESRSGALRSQMRLLAREMRRSRDRSAFVAFASAYAWLPQVMDPLYSAYNKANTPTRPRRVPE